MVRIVFCHCIVVYCYFQNVGMTYILRLSAITVYGYDHTVYSYLTVVICLVPVPYCFISQAQWYGTGGFTAVLRIHTVDTNM